MLSTWPPWAAAAGALGLFALLTPRVRAFASRTIRSWARRPRDTETNRTLIARTLIAETSGLDKYPDAELHGIAYVAINRANESQTTLEEVLRPPGASKYGVWNGSERYAERWESAHTFPKFRRAYAAATRVLQGEVPDPTDGRVLFVHLTGLPAADGGRCTGGRVAIEDSRGRLRCAPAWATNDPKTIGAATFARGD